MFRMANNISGLSLYLNCNLELAIMFYKKLLIGGTKYVHRT